MSLLGPYRVVQLILAGVMLAGLTSCSGFFVDQTLTSIQVTPQSGSVAIGGTVQMAATGINNDGTTAALPTVNWTSSNPQVATVAANGVVTGVSAGTATITATSGTVTGTAMMTAGGSVTAGLTIAPANQTVSVTTRALQFTATSNGQDVTASSTWSSSNTAVAQFNAGSSTATLVGQGTTTITATFTSGGTTSTGTTTLNVGP